jgi:hypothetical protein
MPTIEVPEASLSRLQKVASLLSGTRTAAERALVDLAKTRGADVTSPKVMAEIAQVLARFGGPRISSGEALRLLLDYCEARLGESESPAASSEHALRTQEIRDFRPDTPPDLRHTRVLSARFGNHPATGWNNLVHAAHIEACARLGSLEALKKASKSNLLIGRASSEETKKGFRYVADINVSIQNVSAEQAWLNVLDLARRVKSEVSVDFEWMDKSESAHPGKKGRLRWK